MRFDLVDLQLFIAVADSRSITGGADRAHLALASASERIKGLEEAFAGVLLMRGDLARFASGVRASIHLLANTVGLAEHLPKALAAFLRQNPDINVDVEER